MDGTFATMIILLPSQYTGGKVYLTHASETQAVDFSASPAHLAVLAWYTDVIPEVKPVISGYRFALSYNIIHTSPDMPLPTASSLTGDPCANLRRVLRKWKESGNLDCIAHLLKHQYSEADFGAGASLLKDEDSETIAFVRTAAEGLDFVVLLSQLKYEIREDDWGYSGCCPCITVNTNVTISNWVDLDGRAVLDDPKSIRMDKGCFLPRDALRRVRPDGEDKDDHHSDNDVCLPVKSS